MTGPPRTRESRVVTNEEGAVGRGQIMLGFIGQVKNKNIRFNIEYFKGLFKNITINDSILLVESGGHSQKIEQPIWLPKEDTLVADSRKGDGDSEMNSGFILQSEITIFVNRILRARTE